MIVLDAFSRGVRDDQAADKPFSLLADVPAAGESVILEIWAGIDARRFWPQVLPETEHRGVEDVVMPARR